MDTLFELLPVLIFLLFTVAGFARSSKRDGAAPNPRGSGRADSGDGDGDFDAARRMVEELKRRARGGGGDFPRTLGGEPLVFEPDESPDGEEAEIFEEEFAEPAESARAPAEAPGRNLRRFRRRRFRALCGLPRKAQGSRGVRRLQDESSGAFRGAVAGLRGRRFL